MEYRNTTNIPTELVKVVIAFSADKDIELKRLELRNKELGILHGQFGWYFRNEKKIRLIVPQQIPQAGYNYKLRYLGKRIYIKDRIDFVVTVLAHELRHAWQMQLHPLEYQCVIAKEYDAERYQYEILEKWREIAKEA